MLANFVLSTVLNIVPIIVPAASTSYVLIQAGQDFLSDKQIVMLLTGTEVSHKPPNGKGDAHLYFHKNGNVRIKAWNGKSRNGKWWIAGPQVVCLQGIGGTGEKDFCIKLKRKGKEIWHFFPQTGEQLDVAPWVIRKQGAKADLVTSG